ncbi:MAG: electron transfer flavoprotein-ubiquinone oxidoreductase [Prevotellaceae bacterium]|jgi:electron-transferring-flavoprotein dehydrogenase|nr:electron transfer flavoprotein-ubiquinone oxidoreductase [Prevotellaceae bacterium]
MNNANTVKTDVLIIGGGPSGLATAIHLADLLKKQGLNKEILLVDKGASIGSHILSGAVIKPQVFSELLPDVKLEDIPFDSPVSSDIMYMLFKKGGFRMPFHPPYMGNKGNYTASLSEICRFLATKATEKGVQIYSGFAMSEILYDQNGKVRGAKCIDTGLDHHGNKLENFVAGTSVEAKLTVFAEGTRGSLAKKLIEKFDLQKDRNPQIYSLGCKELWSVPEGTINAGAVYHTMGYPAANENVFGGGFIYGLKDNKVALGLVLGLEAQDPTFDTFKAFQIWKTHPFVSKFLKGGKLLEAGSKTLPEGGYYAQPQYYTDHALIVGDSAGFLAMPALKGIHLGIYSGMKAAETALKALLHNNFSKDTLEAYTDLVEQSQIHKDMYPVRNVRQGFAKGMILGVFHFGTQIVTCGAGLFGKLKSTPDSQETKTVANAKKPLFSEKYKNFEFDKVLTFDKVTDVYYSATNHDEEQVAHVHVNNQQSYAAINIEKFGAPGQYYCPAEVYELHTDKNGHQELRIHAENCMHCKTCDIKEPADGITWNVPNGGNGPDYKYM